MGIRNTLTGERIATSRHGAPRNDRGKSNSLSKEIVGDGLWPSRFTGILQCGFGASKAPPPTNAIFKQSDKSEFAGINKRFIKKYGKNRK